MSPESKKTKIGRSDHEVYPSPPLNLETAQVPLFSQFLGTPTPKKWEGAHYDNIDQVLLINPSATVFVVGDFSIHDKDWLTYSDGTDRPDKLCYNFSISNDLTQISDCDSHSLALLHLFLDTSICSTMAFPPLGYSDPVVVSVSIDFLSNPKRDVPFNWNDSFNLSFSAAASKFC